MCYMPVYNTVRMPLVLNCVTQMMLMMMIDDDHGYHHRHYIGFGTLGSSETGLHFKPFNLE